MQSFICTFSRHLNEFNWMVFGFEPFRAWCTYALGQALCAPCFVTKLEEPCSFSEFPDGPLFSFLISSGSKRRKPDMSVWVKPRPHTHIKHELRFPPQYHTSYKWGYRPAPWHINVTSGCCVQSEGQWLPWIVSY